MLVFVRWTSPTRPRTRRSATSCGRGSTRTCPKFLADWGGDEDPGGGRAGGTSASVSRSQERRQAWQRRLNEGRWAAINWPKDWGGREATPVQNVIYSEEMAQAPHAGHLQRQRHLADRPDDHPLGHRRAEAALAARHPRRRRALVPGLQRARGRQRPRQPAHHRHPRRRRVRRQRPEDLDLHRAPRQVGPVPRAHRPRRPSSEAPSTRASPRSSSTWRRRASSAARSATSPARRCSTRSCSPTPASRPTTGSARRAGLAGRHGHARPRAGRHRRPRHHAWRPTSSDDRRPRERQPRRARRPRDPRAHRPARTPTSSSPGSSTTGRCRRSSRARRTGPRCRWPSCSGATSPRRWPSSPSTCSARPGCSPRAGPTPSTAARWTRLYPFQRYTSIGAGATEVQKNIIADRALLPRK